MNTASSRRISSLPTPKSGMRSTLVAALSAVVNTKRSLPAPPVSVSSPARPFEELLPPLPVIALSSPLPVPSMLPAPTSIRFSMLAPST